MQNLISKQTNMEIQEIDFVSVAISLNSWEMNDL